MEAKLMFQILMLTGFLWNSMSRPGSDDQFASLLRTVVDDDHVGDVNFPPNSHICGPNGYCMDVKGSNYTDGNVIIVWPYRSGPANQLWTFASDGTLRSNGKCATTTGFRRNSKIVIHNCDTAPEYSTIWEFLSTGQLRNPKSGLVMTVLPPHAGTTITLQTNIYSWYQTGNISNSAQRRLVSITGFRGLCLQATDDEVWVTDCDDTPQQQWYFYPDGTIRPQLAIDGCLGYISLADPRVGVHTCGLGPSSERWVYTAKGTIWNQRVNRFLDVKSSDPSLKQIIVWPANGNSNQQWVIKDLA